MNLLFADIGVPMIAFYWPPAWLAIAPIIWVEAWYARRALGVGWKSALSSVGAANLISTIIGIPLAWAIWALLELKYADAALGLSSVGQRLYAVTVQAPWLIPYENHLWWMMPLAALTLTVAFYIMSVGVEWLLMRLIYRKAERGALRNWAWKANLLSYAGLYVLILICMCVPIPILNQILRRPLDFLIYRVFQG